jgi:hypothetical protein
VIRWLRSIVALLSLVATTSACGGSSPTAPTPIASPGDGISGTQPGPPVAPPIAPGPTVTSVPWSQLPALSPEAKAFIVDYNLSTVYRDIEGGVIKRWKNEPIALYHTADFTRMEMVEAATFWHLASDRKIVFRFVDRPEEAQYILDTVWPPPEQMTISPDQACAGSNVSRIQGNAIVSAYAHFAFKVNSACKARLQETIAHEMGHALGLLGGPKGPGHTTNGDIMSPPQYANGSRWHVSDLIKEVLNWIYSVPEGTRPVEDLR